MRVLVIGGTGLIGRATINLLSEKGVEVVVVSRTPASALPSDVKWLRGDIADSEGLDALIGKISPDAILHLAAMLQFACEKDPVSAIKVNVNGTLNVLAAACRARVSRVVFGSSIAIYGPTQLPMKEEGWPYRNTGLYGVTKLMGESLGERFRVEFDLQFVALRYSGVFGQKESDDRDQSSGMSLVRKQILQTGMGNDVVVHASGDETIHLTHAEDAAMATYLALTHARPSFTVYNVAGPQSNFLRLAELADLVRSSVDKAGHVVWGGQGKSAGLVDTARIEQDLEFKPQVSAAEGVRRVLQAP